MFNQNTSFVRAVLIAAGVIALVMFCITLAHADPALHFDRGGTLIINVDLPGVYRIEAEAGTSSFTAEHTYPILDGETEQFNFPSTGEMLVSVRAYGEDDEELIAGSFVTRFATGGFVECSISSEGINIEY